MDHIDLTRYGEFRITLLRHLAGASEPLTVKELMQELGLPRTELMRNKVQQTLLYARNDGQVRRVSRGKYRYSGKPITWHSL
jgi:DNA-binding IclR family transcriptional regulator